MAYRDRFILSVKEFGRKVVIQVGRGKVKYAPADKTVTITYRDHRNRGRSIGKKLK